MNASAKTRVLVVDDSALVREVLREGLSQDPEIEVVACAANPYQARDRILEHRPEVMTLDIEMPRMDGVEFLRRLMPQYPLPVLIVSALTEEGKRVTLDAFEAGAVDVVLKPRSDIARGLRSMIEELRAKVKAVAKVDVRHFQRRHPPEKRQEPQDRAGPAYVSTDKVVAIGASTGGTEALRAIITSLDVAAPGMVVVQHMPAGFTRLFAERLNELSQVEVSEAVTGDRVHPGRVLIAPGGTDLLVRRSGAVYVVESCPCDGRSVHCPAVNRLFLSVANAAGANALGVLLTGMGKDGAAGMLAMRGVGARTIAQDEATSVIFGMPRAAIECGAAMRVLPLDRIPDAITAFGLR